MHKVLSTVEAGLELLQNCTRVLHVRELRNLRRTTLSCVAEVDTCATVALQSRSIVVNIRCKNRQLQSKRCFLHYLLVYISDSRSL